MKPTEEVIFVLNKLKNSDINYALMRNLDFLINQNIEVGKDVDILVQKKDINKIKQIFKELNYKKQPISPFSKHLGFAKYLPNNFKLIKFHFHIDGISGRNVQYLDGQILLSRKQPILNYHTLSDEDTLINLIFHYKDAYENKLKTLLDLNLDYDYIEKTLTSKTNSKISKKMTKFVKLKDMNSLLSTRKKLKNALFNSPTKYISAGYTTIGSGIWKFSNLFKKSPMITFMGMDGAGKTTTTNEMIKILNKNHLKSALIYTGRGKNNLLPIQYFGRKFKKIEMKKDNSKLNNPNEYKIKKPSTKKKIIYSLAAPIFALDLIIRYYVQIWSKRKTKEIVLTDRYSTDLLLMKNVPEWEKRFLYAISPKPSKVIYLYNDIEVLHKRKPNHPFDDLQRQEKLFKKINSKLEPIKIKNEDLGETKKI